MTSDAKIEKIQAVLNDFTDFSDRLMRLFGDQMPAKNELELTKGVLKKIEDILKEST